MIFFRQTRPLLSAEQGKRSVASTASTGTLHTVANIFDIWPLDIIVTF